MKRRWLIRTIFMLPILLCIVGWGWSTTQEGWITYNCADHRVICYTSWGTVGVETSSNHTWTMRDGWQCEVMALDKIRLLPTNGFLGFDYCYGESRSEIYRNYIEVSYWFLIVVFSLALLYVWRKTRPKPNPATAFPVETDIMKP